MTLLRIISLLTFTFGVFAFGSMLLYWPSCWSGQPYCERRHGVRTRYRPETMGVRVGTIMIVLCFVWFCAELLRLLLDLHPASRTQWLDLIRVTLVFLFPPLIMQITYVDAQQHDRPLRSVLWRLGLVLVWILSPALAVYILLAVFDVVPRVSGFGRFIGLSIGAMFTLAGTYGALGMTLGRSQRETATERSGRRWMTGLYIALIVFLLLVTLTHAAGASMAELFRFVGGSMPLLFIFTSLYHESRFEFFDLFIKRGLFLLVTVALLTVAFAVALPWLESLDLGWARPWVFAVALLPLGMALPWLHRRLGQWLDNKWLGRQLPPVEAIKQFLGDLGSACTREELIRQAQTGLSTIFGAPVRVHADLAEAPEPDFQCVLDVPLRSAGRRDGVILLGRRATQQPYFSEDITLLRSLADVFSFMLDNMRLQERRKEQEQVAQELSLQASRSELKALRAQINPHFLFNALNAIAGLIHKDPLRADQTVEQLAEIFRYTLRGSESEWALLEQELTFARSYLEVEQARFGDKLQIAVEVAPDVAGLRIPTMMVQTLVENAIKHGVCSVRGPSSVAVEARREDDHLVIEVTDSGPGFFENGQSDARGPGRPRGAGYGLRNVRERLAGHYGDGADLRVARDEDRGRTVVSLVLPLEAPGERETGGAESHGVA